jgi:hypothetical protein
MLQEPLTAEFALDQLQNLCASDLEYNIYDLLTLRGCLESIKPLN